MHKVIEILFTYTENNWYIVTLYPFTYLVSSHKCVFQSGDGQGAGEDHVGDITGDECVQACLEKKKTNNNINGVTIRQDGASGCYCEKEMDGRAGSTTYESCYLEGKFYSLGRLWYDIQNLLVFYYIVDLSIFILILISVTICSLIFFTWKVTFIFFSFICLYWLKLYLFT